ncbi:DUF6908 domain-containing protein [Chitinophaga sp.]|uniref:DUF6908 domain-containing protein n=1 Tax=Chitinophaga sp. TaxID=1869181 RepID=UPI002F95A258
MKKLNQYSTQVFCQILLTLGSRNHFKIYHEPYMPLSFEKLYSGIKTPWGAGTVYSLSHSFVQNGDLMRDPEICFIVVDNREQPDDWQLIGIYPQLIQQDTMGLYKECVIIEDFTVTRYHPKWQNDICNLANLWLKNIKDQGFL